MESLSNEHVFNAGKRTKSRPKGPLLAVVLPTARKAAGVPAARLLMLNLPQKSSTAVQKCEKRHPLIRGLPCTSMRVRDRIGLSEGWKGAGGEEAGGKRKQDKEECSRYPQAIVCTSEFMETPALELEASYSLPETRLPEVAEIRAIRRFFREIGVEHPSI